MVSRCYLVKLVSLAEWGTPVTPGTLPFNAVQMMAIFATSIYITRVRPFHQWMLYRPQNIDWHLLAALIINPVWLLHHKSWFSWLNVDWLDWWFNQSTNVSILSHTEPESSLAIFFTNEKQVLFCLDWSKRDVQTVDSFSMSGCCQPNWVMACRASSANCATVYSTSPDSRTRLKGGNIIWRSMIKRIVQSQPIHDSDSYYP